MIVDISPLVQALIGTAAAVVTASGPIVAALIARKLHLEGNAAAVTAIDQACNTGAGLAYAALVAESNKPASVDIKSAAIASGVQHVLATVPDAIARSGITEDAIGRMIVGRLGTLLSRDPSVPAGPSASVPPPVAGAAA